jgi:serpin B
MKRHSKAALALMGLLGCGKSFDEAKPPGEAQSSLPRVQAVNVAPADVSALVAGNSGFATSLYRQSSGTSGNALFSPYGISFNMAMLREGVSATKKAGIDSTMGFASSDAQLDPAFDALDLQLEAISGKTASGSGQQFLTAGAVWSAMTPSSTWLDTLAQYYGAGVLQGPDPAQAISDFLTTVPGAAGLPFELAEPCDLALVSVVHLDAAWKTSFDATATAPATFHRLDGSVVSAPTMSLTTELPVATTSPRAVELPYDGDALTMLIVVPDDLATFESTLGPSTVSDVVARLGTQNTALALPKFSFQKSLSVLSAMQAMGLPLDSGHWQIFHSSKISVDESGAIATSSTVTSNTPSVVLTPTPFAVDHPFVFFIRDRTTGSLLFIGRVADPTAP